MTKRSEDGVPRPVPRDWLPDPQPFEGDRKWQLETERIMAAAGPELERLRRRQPAGEVRSWDRIGLWWKPAAALAAASTALLLLTGRQAVLTEPASGSIPLGLVASDGDPAILWEAVGIQVDPVLALIAVQASPPTGTEEANP